MNKITLDELSESLKTYLQGLGLTEEQVNVIVSNKIDELVGIAPDALNSLEELARALNNNPDFANSVLNNMGDLTGLQTTAKNNLVAAINEVFQSGNNAKQGLVDVLIAKGINASTSESWDNLNGKVASIPKGVTSVASSSGDRLFTDNGHGGMSNLQYKCFFTGTVHVVSGLRNDIQSSNPNVWLRLYKNGILYKEYKIGGTDGNLVSKTDIIEVVPGDVISCTAESGYTTNTKFEITIRATLTY